MSHLRSVVSISSCVFNPALFLMSWPYCHVPMCSAFLRFFLAISLIDSLCMTPLILGLLTVALPLTMIALLDLCLFILIVSLLNPLTTTAVVLTLGWILTVTSAKPGRNCLQRSWPQRLFYLRHIGCILEICFLYQLNECRILAQLHRKSVKNGGSTCFDMAWM